MPHHCLKREAKLYETHGGDKVIVSRLFQVLSYLEAMTVSLHVGFGEFMRSLEYACLGGAASSMMMIFPC